MSVRSASRWAAVLVGIVTSSVGAQYQRPTSMLVPSGLPGKVQTALQAVCANQCSATRLGGRTFSEGIVAGSVAPAAGLPADSALGSALAPSARTLILKQFGAEPNFVWSARTLSARAEYGMTFQAANRAVQAEMGPDAPYLPLLTANYIFVVGSGSEPKEEAKKDGTTVSSKVNVAVFKIGYDDAGAARSAISAYYCAESCGDRAARKSAFEAYAPPMKYVASFSVEASGSASTADSAYLALASDLIENIIDETASKDDAFAVTSPVVATSPVGAMIGSREGIQRRTRFYSYEGDKRRGVFIVSQVADNSAGLIDRSDVGGAAKVAAVDTTRFKRVYPGAVARGHVLKERPSELSLSLGLHLPGDGTTASGDPVTISGSFISLEARYEGALPKQVPLGVKPIAGALRFNTGNGVESITYLSLGAGYEFMPLGGKFRIMPLVVGGKAVQATDQDGNEFDVENLAVTFGLDFGIRFTPEIEIGGSLRSTGTAMNVSDRFSDETSVEAVGVPTFGLAVRLQRGRWGLF